MYIYRAANSISPTSPNLSHIHKNNKNPETAESKFQKKKTHIMVKPESSKSSAERSNDSAKYKGVRKRKWGKWVSEIRLPNSRERIWLGSYDSAEKAARAFDAALFCLRGHSAKFNFPENPPDIVGGRSLTPSEIQVAAARFANSEPRPGCPNRSFPESSSSSSSQMQVESPSPSVSDGAAQLGSETTLDGSFLDLFSTMGSDNSTMPGGSFDIFPGFDDFSNEFYVPPLPSVDDVAEDNCDVSFSQDSFLWNFN